VQQKFTFIVIGDTRSNRPVVQPPMFKRAIREINLLRPAFAIDCGDLILGYTGDKALLKAMWDEYVKVTADVRVPFFPVAGNHDIWNDYSEKVYAEVMGELYYSFDYGDSHFVVLNTHIAGYTSRISPEQFEWLKQDLAAHSSAEHVFAFMHLPLFRSHKALWEPIHQLLRQYNVKAVFAGDIHIYRRDERDAIKYIITGGGGAEFHQTRHEGGFHHYTLVTVDRDEIHLAVVKTGAIEDENVITPAIVNEYFKVRSSFSHIPVVLPAEPGHEAEVSVTIANRLDRPASGVLELRAREDGWRFDPPEVPYTIEAAGSTKLRAKVGFSRKPEDAKRPPYLRTLRKYADDRVTEVKQDLVIFPAAYTSSAEPRYTAPRAETPIQVDGSLKDWAGIPSQAIGRENAEVSSGAKWRGPEDLSAGFKAAWDADNLYIAAEVRDNEFSQEFDGTDLWKGDAVRFGLDVKWLGGHRYYDLTLALTKNGPKGYVIKKALEEDPAVTLKVAQAKGITTYEAAIPWRILPPLAPLPGVGVRFNMMVTDMDTSGQKGFLQWTPGLREGDIPKYGMLVLSE